MAHSRFVKLTRHYLAMVDAEDWERVRQYKWHAVTNGHGGTYAYRQITGTNAKQSMQHFILDTTQKIDHINRNGLDNRRSNLRMCTDSQNLANRKQITGKYKGVYLRHDGKKYCAEVQHKYLGSFNSEEEAARAYDVKAKEVYGEFAFLNFGD